MKRRRLTAWTAAVLALGLALPPLCEAQGTGPPGPGPAGAKKASDPSRVPGGVYSASDGNGQIRLFWLPAGAAWPAGGWRLEEADTGRVLTARIGPGSDPALAAALSAKELEGFKKLPQLFASAGNETQKKMAHAVTITRAMTDWAYAQAVGLGRVLTNVPAGPRAYRVVALDAAGNPTGMTLTSRPVDSTSASLLPTPPTALRGESVVGGVALYWEPPAGPRSAVAAYYVEREVGGATTPVTLRPIGLSRQRTAQTPALIDANAPLEREILYRAYGIDVFGRRSSPATVRILAVDLAALIPPQVTAKGGPGSVALTWKPNPSPYTAGYLVERSMLYAGPYESLTPQGLSARDLRFDDRSVVGGTAYYFRVRSLGPRGAAGEPSAPVMAQPVNPDRPPRPQALKADVGRTRVRLTWQAVQFPVAGYLVERRTQGASRWIQLTERLTPEPLYDDHFPLHESGAFAYRVTAVAFDNKASDPSSPVQVTLLDTRPPSPPAITAIDGSNGKVRLTFQPMPPEDDVQQFYVVRSVSEDDPGLVIGDPIPARGRSFEDTFVKVGQRYSYRMVAVDRGGNRSDLSEPRAVTVMHAAIPKPRRPQARLVQDPIPYVMIAFAKPPAGLGLLIQRKAGGEEWRTIIGPVVDETQAADTQVPEKGVLSYRLLYQVESGVVGEPSDTAEITR